MHAKKFIKFIKFILIGLISLTIISTTAIFAGCNDNANGGTFIIELYPEYAPQTVDNFVKLTEEGFFDGLTFHRIVDGFMAQGGGYDANGVKKEAQTIFGEFANNGYTQNTLKHTKGVVSMARIGGMNDSASSEFFIMYGDAPLLDGDYAAFGKVIEGMDVVEKFLTVERTMGFDGDLSSPVNPVIIKKMTVDNSGDNPKIKVEMGAIK